jgi:LysM repeat protein
MPKQGKQMRHKVHVKKGDTVQVIAGRDKGKVGEIVKVMPRSSQVLVEGVNIRTRHMKPRKTANLGRLSPRSFPSIAPTSCFIPKSKRWPAGVATPLPRMGGRFGC